MKKQTKKVTKKHESGRSMIEMVGVLAVMGLITAAAFVLITSALRSQKLPRVIEDGSAIAAGIRLVHNTKEDFDKVTNNDLKLIGYYDVKTPYNDTTTTGVEDGKYHVAKNTNVNKFDISFGTGTGSNGTAACSALATQLGGINGCTATCSSTKVTVTCEKYANN